MRKVRGFEKYKITEDGRVWSDFRGGRWIKPYRNNKGYWCVSLYDGGNKSKVMTVHRLVALTFLGEPPSGKNNVCHKDGDQQNNNVSNLYWGTIKENVADAVKHGIYKCEKNGNSTLNNEQVAALKICWELVPRGKKEMFANMFSVHPSTIKRAVCGKTWKAIEYERNN
jgi:hypothetical protein